MKRIFTPTSSGSDWQKLLVKPTLHWRQGKSAMSAAASWEAAGDKLPPEISLALNSSYVPEIRGLKLLAAIPEWETPLPGGTRASFTDILAVTRNEFGVCVLAVEAKADEDFGPLVSEKLAEASDGQKERLESLRSCLGLKVLDGDIRYQLLHRTASAVLSAQEFGASTAVMLVHSFGKRPELRADFERFCEAMGAEPRSPSVRQVVLKDQPRLVLAWVDGDPRFANETLPSDPAYASVPLSSAKYSPTEIRVRRLRRLAQIVFDHFEEGSGMDTRYFEHPFVHDTLTIKGVSSKGKGHREHVVPRGYLRDHCLAMYKEGASVEEVTVFLDKNLWIVEITKEEARHLDHGLGFKVKMTDGWVAGDDPLARLTAAGIRLRDPATPSDSTER
jgi:hypothetical protein